MQNELTANIPSKKQKVGVVFLLDSACGPLVAVFHRHALNNKGNHVNDDEWHDVPGGKRDFNTAAGRIETIEEAVIREIHEELGIDITAADIRNVFDGATVVHPKTPATISEFVLVKCPQGQYPHNALPDEHGKLELMRPKFAARFLKDRIPEQVRDFLLGF